MWLAGGGVGGGGGCISKTLVRYFSRKCAVNLRKINPKVPTQEATSIAEDLYHVIKQHGPLSVSNTWIHAKESNISGLNSKTHMKIMLKWMRGRKMLKLICHQVGSGKKFLHSTLPEEPETEESRNALELKLKAEKPATKRRKQFK
ncbi:hypothetical protein LguiA_015891 [Lonicera macranthoides]